MKKDTLERPSFRSLQVASCRDGVNWKGGKTYQKANVTKGDSLDNVIRYVHIAIAAVALSGLPNNPIQDNHHRRRWTANTLCVM